MPLAPIVYGLAVLFGLAAPAGLIYGRISLGNYVTDRKQIENETGTPIIGELSYIYSKKPLVVANESNNFAVSQQFRMLRTHLYHLYEQSVTGRVTLLTSSVTGEGKTFVSSNLAITLAYVPRRPYYWTWTFVNPKSPIISVWLKHIRALVIILTEKL